MKENTINFKEKLNNKLNLPATWTKKKMASLLLMGLMSVNGVEAGQNFRSCLARHSDSKIYNSLLEFPFNKNSIINSGSRLNVCCDKLQCVPDSDDGNYAGCFYCQKLGQNNVFSIFCDDHIYCGGIVGNALIMDRTMLGACPANIETVDDYLKTVDVYNRTGDGTASWVCADDKSSPCHDLASPFPDSSSSSTKTVPIAIGITVGVIAIGGTTYYVVRKRKKDSSLQGQEIGLVPLKELLGLPVKDSDLQLQQLEQLITQTKSQIGTNLIVALETLLDTQTEITQGNNNFAIRQLQREAKEKLQSKLSLEEINTLCQLQSEIVRLQGQKIVNQAPTNSKEQIKNLQSELNSVKSKLNNLSNDAQKTQLENKLTDIKNQINSLSGQNNSPPQSTIKKLEKELKKIKQQIENKYNPDDPDEGPEPTNKNKAKAKFVGKSLKDQDSGNFDNYKFLKEGTRGAENIFYISKNHPRIKELLSQNKLQKDKKFTVRYGKVDKKSDSGLLFTFNENNQELEIIEVGNPSPQPDSKGFKFVGTKINDNTYKYKIVLDVDGISRKTLNKPFEFVVIKTDSFNNIPQNPSRFQEHFEKSRDNQVASFFSPSDNCLICPVPKGTADYINISQFTKNAPDEQQQVLWKEVAIKLMEELEKNQDSPRWLNTEGTGVYYLHPTTPIATIIPITISARAQFDEDIAKQLRKSREEYDALQKNIEYLDCCYPKIKRKTITILDVREKNLTGSLDLSDFVNLELDNCRQLRILNCNDNQLVNLDLNNLDKLEGIRCGNNYLSDLVISPLQVEQLTYLYAENNNFSPQDCSIFRKIINLRELYIGNHDQEKIQQGIYNRFSGSLEPLRDLSKLEYLDISNTDIDSGLRYLQDSVQDFSCSTNERPDSKVKILEQELRKHGKSIDANSEKAKTIQLEQTENLTNQFDAEQQSQILQRESIVPSSKERDKITKLNIRDKNLEGDLDLSDFVNCQILNCLNNKITSLNLSNCLKLKKLNCSFNKLTNLHLDNLTQLQRIDCDNNYLNSFDYSVLNPEKLIYLCINANNLPKQDLSVFSKFTNLEQLRELYISNTDLNEVDVNKLPPNLEYINYSTTGRPTCKLTEIVPLLKKRNYYGRCCQCQQINTNIFNDGGIIVLKTLNNSQNITIGFLTEIANTKLVDFDSVKCYGISQDPTTKNYLMVMEYIEGGNLRDYLKNNASELRLKDIHLQGLVHRDFHAGNILIKADGDYFSSFITDLGLSQPANSQSQVGEIFGVMPYVAPEVLQNKPYTPASDIYSFGIIAYEMCSGLPPYYNMPHDISLIIRVCQGLRPHADELYEALEDWENEIIFKKDTKFTRQLQAAEQHNQTLPKEVRFPKYEIHQGACYHSKSINTQQITQLLQLQQEVNRQPYASKDLLHNS
ncbi:6738_t:CDS:10 [Entrophospora sp. SA101]|nr:6738_t:CDS:10 [Entrophospora sp. SA101]